VVSGEEEMRVVVCYTGDRGVSKLGMARNGGLTGNEVELGGLQKQ
jgi:hypothetical protein